MRVRECNRRSFPKLLIQFKWQTPTFFYSLSLSEKVVRNWWDRSRSFDEMATVGRPFLPHLLHPVLRGRSNRVISNSDRSLAFTEHSEGRGAIVFSIFFQRRTQVPKGDWGGFKPRRSIFQRTRLKATSPHFPSGEFWVRKLQVWGLISRRSRLGTNLTPVRRSIGLVSSTFDLTSVKTLNFEIESNPIPVN